MAIEPRETAATRGPRLEWEGKRTQVDRIELPFQVIETVNEPRQKDLFSAQAAEQSLATGWRNKLIWGDNKLVCASLLKEFEGKIDLIYIDPPFDTGQDFSFRVSVGDQELTKLPSIIEAKAYNDMWGSFDSYLQMLYDRLVLMRELLSDRGSLHVHLDWHVGHYVKALLDGVFGTDNFVNEIVWYYYNKFQGNVNRFASNHDVIFWYRRGDSYVFKPVREKREGGPVRQIKRAWDREKGSIINVKGADGKVLYRETDERTVDDVWRISMLQPADRSQNVGFQTQKPEALLERIIAASSNEGDLVADFFCGSGTTLAVAEKLGRRWIGADLGRFAIHTSRKRLLDMPGCKPFEVLNLGKYERQYWQGVTTGRDDAAYVKLMLQLYRAQPLDEGTMVHGVRAGVAVHVGPIDSVVTIEEALASVEGARAGLQTPARARLGLADGHQGNRHRPGPRPWRSACPEADSVRDHGPAGA